MFFQNLVLGNNTQAVEWWANPPLNPYLKVHIFNYTNYKEFLSGEDKILKLQDYGPLVYTEKVSKIDIVFNENGTVSYKVIS